MNRLQRIKKVVKYAIVQGVGENQAEIGQKMGYSNKSAFSHVLNGQDKEPNNFVGRLLELVPDVNAQWIETGEGEMLNDSKQKPSQIVGNSNNVLSNNINDAATIKEIVQMLTEKHEREIVAKDEQISKSQEQIDRLISLLEKK